MILTRRIQESIKIGKDIEVTVIGVKGNQVRIGISAPDDVAVDRIGNFTKKTGRQMKYTSHCGICVALSNLSGLSKLAEILKTV